MPDTIIFDSLGFVKRGVEAGASPELAEWLAREQVQLLEHNLATKKDIEGLRAATQKDIEGLRAATQTDLANLESRLIKWFVGALFLSAGLVVAGVGILVQVLLS